MDINEKKNVNFKTAALMLMFFIVLVSFVYVLTAGSKDSEIEPTIEDVSARFQDAQQEPNRETNQPLDNEMDNTLSEGEVANVELATYVKYGQSVSQLSDIKFENDYNVIFVAASWCATCEGLVKDLEQNANLIPPTVTVHQIDFNLHENIRKENYQVTQQHVLIQVDSEGKVIKQWSQSPTVAAVLEEIILNV